MENLNTHRRVQFSSCDECRQARVACDARKWAHIAGSAPEVSAGVVCSRCRNRRRRCTFEWMRTITKDLPRANARPRSRLERERLSSATLSAVQQPRTTEVNLRHSQPPSDAYSHLPSVPNVEGIFSSADQQWLQTIYQQSFETIFGSWMGAHSCPFMFRQRDLHQVSLSISSLCGKLDAWLRDETDDDHYEAGINQQIETSLSRTIQTFAIRWLPVLSGNTCGDPFTEKVISMWRYTRRDMLRVINRPSYRSVLSLLLFGLTPLPEGISEAEELDGLSGQVCVQSALQQVQALRARQRILRFNGDKVSPIKPVKSFSPGKDSTSTADFINAENTVFWAALTFDTSASLTLCARPSLSSGFFGVESETCWQLVRTCRKIFHETTKEWHRADFELTDFNANQIIAAAAAWKLLVWKMTAVFKEALGDGFGDKEVNRAFDAVLDAIQQFDTSYRSLLAACQKRIGYFQQETKLRWYELMLHYHLSILLLVDMVEATDYCDLLPRVVGARTEAETWVLNCLDFGLNCTFNVSLSSPSREAGATPAAGSAIVCLISIDPYPHHVVAGVELLRKAIHRDFGAGKIGAEVRNNLIATLGRALQHLPSSSKSVQAARAKAMANPSE